MKKYFFIIFLFSLILNLHGQQESGTAQDENIFQKSENSQQINTPDFQTEDGPNGPPVDDEIPIDGYLPILIAAGIFIIFSMKKKNILAKSDFKNQIFLFLLPCRIKNFLLLMKLNKN